jgi:putative peptide zinc metalloprotease protein
VITALSLGILFIPLSSKTVYPCRLESAETRKLTIPLRTSVSKVFIREGQTVGAGELLFSLDPALLQLELDKKEPAKEIIKLEIQLMLLDIKEIGNVDRKLIELAQLGHEKSILEKDFRTAHEGIIAPFPAAVVRLDRRLKPGFLPGEGAIVGEIASVTDCEVRMLVPEDEIHKTWIGAAVEIWFPAKSDTVFREKITDMRPQSEKDLKTSPFSSRFGGEIAVESDSGRNTDAPLTAQYVCAVRFPHDTGLRLGVTGLCSVSAPPQSLFSRARAGIARTVNQDFQR